MKGIGEPFVADARFYEKLLRLVCQALRSPTENLVLGKTQRAIQGAHLAGCRAGDLPIAPDQFAGAITKSVLMTEQERLVVPPARWPCLAPLLEDGRLSEFRGEPLPEPPA